MRSLVINKLLLFQYRLEKLFERKKATHIRVVNRGEELVSLKPCAFYRGYPYMKKGNGLCKHGNCQVGCNGDFTYCENSKTLKKYFREAGLGWHGRGKRNGTD